MKTVTKLYYLFFGVQITLGWIMSFVGRLKVSNLCFILATLSFAMGNWTRIRELEN